MGDPMGDPMGESGWGRYGNRSVELWMPDALQIQQSKANASFEFAVSDISTGDSRWNSLREKIYSSPFLTSNRHMEKRVARGPWLLRDVRKPFLQHY